MLFYMREKARSSGGERFLDTEEVGGSRPPGPTITTCQTPFISSWLFAHSNFQQGVKGKVKRTSDS